MEEKIINYSSKIDKDKITLYGAGKFHEESITLNKEQCCLLFIDLWKFLELGKTI